MWLFHVKVFDVALKPFHWHTFSHMLVEVISHKWFFTQMTFLQICRIFMFCYYVPFERPIITSKSFTNFTKRFFYGTLFHINQLMICKCKCLLFTNIEFIVMLFPGMALKFLKVMIRFVTFTTENFIWPNHFWIWEKMRTCRAASLDYYLKIWYDSNWKMWIT